MCGNNAGKFRDWTVHFGQEFELIFKTDCSNNFYGFKIEWECYDQIDGKNQFFIRLGKKNTSGVSKPGPLVVVDDYDNEDSVAIIPEYGSGRDFKMQIY